LTGAAISSRTKIAIELRRHELGRDRLLEDDVDDVLAVERAGAAEERLLAEVVLRGVELELEHVVGPAGERARRLAHVALGVVADAHREQLEQLAAEVLVRVLLDVLAVVEGRRACPGSLRIRPSSPRSVPAALRRKHPRSAAASSR
jgi:hypothetical protein